MANDLADTVSERAWREADSHLKQVLRRLPEAAAKKPKKRKYVHELRVESRRSEAALDLYADFLPKRHRKRLQKQLKKIRRAAGRARDLDVFLELLEKDKTGGDAAALLKIAQRHRDKAQRDMIAAGRAARKSGFRKYVRAFLKEAGRQRGSVGARFVPWARLELRPLVRAFFAAVPPADPALKDLHAFRIATKNLRYRLEMLESAFPAAVRKDLLPLLAAVQERLGELNDIAVRKRRLEKWLAQMKDKAAARSLRRHIALDDAFLAQARTDVARWCTPVFLGQLRGNFDALLTGLALVA